MVLSVVLSLVSPEMMVMISQPQTRRAPRRLVRALAFGLALAPGLPVLAADPLARLPGSPAAAGLPRLQSQVSCPALQQRVQASLGAEARVWSVSVADGSGRLLADVNGLQPQGARLQPEAAEHGLRSGSSRP